MKPLIYIAGPYTHPDPVENTHRAIVAAESLYARGDDLVVPYVPHLTLLWHLVAPHPVEFWYEHDMAMLLRSDAVLRLPGHSTGSDAEVGVALGTGIPVFFTEDGVLDWAARR